MCQKIEYCTLYVFYNSKNTFGKFGPFTKDFENIQYEPFWKYIINLDWEIIDNDSSEVDSVLQIDGSRKQLKFTAKKLLQESNQNITGFEILGKCKCNGWIVDLDGKLENNYLNIKEGKK
jgi:hypothetical protein